MLKWDAVAVGNFLGSPAVFEGNSTYTFSFKMLGQRARMVVLPECNEVTIRVENDRQECARWQLICAEISYNDELPEEGGDCLVFNSRCAEGNAGPPTHWIVLGREGTGFSILTVFRSEDD